MEYLIGVVMALAIGFFASAVGFDRNRAFYPVVMIVIASYYALFALMGGSLHSHLVSNPGVPGWWPGWCLSYDVTAAGYLAWLLLRSGGPARP